MYCLTAADADPAAWSDAGILNINKPSGLTSFGVVKKIRYWTGIKKVGHAGTLDPLATGVLVVLTGKATKRSAEFMNTQKEYKAVIRLGECSDTDDSEGEITGRCEVPPLSRKTIESMLQEFTGIIDQVPPMFSALRKNGKRLYKLARQGVVVEREPRKVHIYHIDVLKWNNPELEISVTCGRGTYIRALARDIGSRLNVGGHLTSLTRTRVGDCRLADSWDLETLKSALQQKNENIPLT